MTQEEMLTLEKGLSFTKNGTHRLLFTEKPKGLKDGKDLSIPSATMAGLLNFIRVRAESILARKDETHILVESRLSKISLVMGEHRGQKYLGDKAYKPMVVITAESSYSDDFKKVLDYLGKTHNSPHDLAMRLRQEEYLFENSNEWSRVVSSLRSTVMKARKIMEDTSKDNEARKKRMEVEIEKDSQLDLTWNFSVPIYEGEEKSIIQAKAIWEVDAAFDVKLVLLNGGVENIRRNALKEMTNRTVQAIQEALKDEVPIVIVDGMAPPAVDK